MNNLTMNEYYNDYEIDAVKYHICRINPQTKLEADKMFKWLEEYGFGWEAVDIASDQLITENF